MERKKEIGNNSQNNLFENIERVFCPYYVMKVPLFRCSYCEFFSKDVWWRGIPDFLALDGETATMIDYKTGKSSKYADTKQLELLALAIFKHFPEVNQIKAGLLFVVAKDFVKAKYNRFDHERTWVKWLAETSRLEQALELNVWNPKPNFSCKSWCNVTDCIHNGRGNR